MSLFEIFSERGNPYGNALLNWAGDPAGEILVYAWNYRMAAMNLVSLRERQKVCALDHAAIPILFLYRHAFELYLKGLIYKAAAASVNENEISIAIPKIWKEHSLVKLVNISTPVLAESNQHALTRGGELQRKVTDLAKLIDRLDSGSYTFRYPVTSKGEPSLPANFFTNIFRFSDEFERVFDDLAQFCGSLDKMQNDAHAQFKLNLHRVK